MIRIADAIAAIQPHLAQVAASEGTEIVVISMERWRDGWRVVYNTIEFAHSFDPMDGLLGNVPLLVRDDGSIGPAE